MAGQRPVATPEALSARHYHHAKTAAIIERGIEDIFLTGPASATAFDHYWKTRIGTVAHHPDPSGRAHR